MKNFKSYPNFNLESISLRNGEPPTFTVEAELTPADIWPDMFRGGVHVKGGLTMTPDDRITKAQMLKKEFTIAATTAKYTPKSIEYSADHKTVVVIWSDGDKTIVRRSDNDPDDIYMAFTAALAKKIFGSNSAVKRVIQNKTNEHQPKEKKRNDAFDAVSYAFQALAKAAKRFPMPGETVKSGNIDADKELGLVLPIDSVTSPEGIIQCLNTPIKLKYSDTLLPLNDFTKEINDWLAERGGATRAEINNEIVRRWKEAKE